MAMGAKILGGLGKSGGLLGGFNRSLAPSEVAAARRNPAFNVVRGTKTVNPVRNIGRTASGYGDWQKAKAEAGTHKIDTFSQELDRDWLGEVGKSLSYEEELTAPSGGRIGQPSPGDFQNQFDIASYSPWIEKYKRKGLFS